MAPGSCFVGDKEAAARQLTLLLRRLGLPSSCRSSREVKAAYARLALRLHPDTRHSSCSSSTAVVAGPTGSSRSSNNSSVSLSSPSSSSSEEFKELHAAYRRCMQLITVVPPAAGSAASASPANRSSRPSRNSSNEDWIRSAVWGDASGNHTGAATSPKDSHNSKHRAAAERTAGVTGPAAAVFGGFTGASHAAAGASSSFVGGDNGAAAAGPSSRTRASSYAAAAERRAAATPGHHATAFAAHSYVFGAAGGGRAEQRGDGSTSRSSAPLYGAGYVPGGAFAAATARAAAAAAAAAHQRTRAWQQQKQQQHRNAVWGDDEPFSSSCNRADSLLRLAGVAAGFMGMGLLLFSTKSVEQQHQQHSRHHIMTWRDYIHLLHERQADRPETLLPMDDTAGTAAATAAGTAAAAAAGTAAGTAATTAVAGAAVSHPGSSATSLPHLTRSRTADFYTGAARDGQEAQLGLQQHHEQDGCYCCSSARPDVLLLEFDADGRAISDAAGEHVSVNEMKKRREAKVGGAYDNSTGNSGSEGEHNDRWTCSSNSKEEEASHSSSRNDVWGVDRRQEKGHTSLFEEQYCRRSVGLPGRRHRVARSFSPAGIPFSSSTLSASPVPLSPFAPGRRDSATTAPPLPGAQQQSQQQQKEEATGEKKRGSEKQTNMFFPRVQAVEERPEGTASPSATEASWAKEDLLFYEEALDSPASADEKQQLLDGNVLHREQGFDSPASADGKQQLLDGNVLHGEQCFVSSPFPSTGSNSSMWGSNRQQNPLSSGSSNNSSSRISSSRKGGSTGLFYSDEAEASSGKKGRANVYRPGTEKTGDLKRQRSFAAADAGRRWPERGDDNDSVREGVEDAETAERLSSGRRAAQRSSQMTAAATAADETAAAGTIEAREEGSGYSAEGHIRGRRDAKSTRSAEAAKAQPRTGVPPVSFTSGTRGTHRESRYFLGRGGCSGVGFDDFLLSEEAAAEQQQHQQQEQHERRHRQQTG